MFRRLSNTNGFGQWNIHDNMLDLIDFLDEQLVDEADRPQFDIIYQLRRVIDPSGTQTQQEASITDGRGRPIYGSRRREGDVVDMRYHARGGPQMNLEVDLDPNNQREHRAGHLTAMQHAYNRWVNNGRQGPNPLEGVGSVFVTANPPGRRGQIGNVTGVNRVEYRAGSDGRVRAVNTGRITLPGAGAPPQAVAQQLQGMFTTVRSPTPSIRNLRPTRAQRQRLRTSRGGNTLRRQPRR